MAFDLRAQALDTLLSALELAVPGSRLSPRTAATDTMKQSPVTVAPRSRLTPPRYPEDERRQNSEGEVWAEFVVDSSGRADLSTFRAVLSDRRSFERSVRDFLEGAEFIPARVNDHPVRQRVRQRFSFGLKR